MQKEQVLLDIKKGGVVAVVRGNTKEEAIKISDECVNGGIKAIELTFTTPLAHEAIKELSQKYGDSVIIGAGTVLDSETARIAILYGAKFIVSPHLNKEVIRLCNRYRVACMSGIMTVTEAVSAMEYGCDILKLFPGEVMGMGFLKAIKAPLPQAQIMPTGGVTAQNAAEWLEAGACAVGAGGALTKGDTAKNAAEFVKSIASYRGEQ